MFLAKTQGFRDPRSAEDAGLFKNGVTRAAVQLCPRIAENNRGDMIIVGSMTNGHDVQVLFCGRRQTHALRLKVELGLRWSAAIKAVGPQNRAKVDVRSVRLPVQVEGSWRPIFRRDSIGVETREYQLIAARWTYVSLAGDVEIAGEPVRQEDDISNQMIAPDRAARQPSYL